MATAQNGKSGTSQGTTPNGRPFVALQTQVKTLQQQIDLVTANDASQDALLSALGAAVFSLEARMASALASIEELQAHDAFLGQWITALDSQWHDAEALLAQNEQNLQSLIDADRALQELLAALQLRADSLESRLASLEGQVSTLSSSTASELAAVNAAIDGLQLQVNHKQEAISQACAPGSSIRQINASTGAVTCEIDDSSAGGSVGHLSTVDFTDTFRTIPAGGVGSSSSFCPSGYVSTGGGYHKDLPGDVYLDAPTTNGWIVAVHNPTAGPTLVRAFTRCAQVTP